MKKAFALILALFIALAIVACQTTAGETTGEETTTTTFIPPTNLSNPSSFKDVEFVNFSTEFVSETAGNSIRYYFFADKPKIPYVDITEFVTMLSGIIDDTIKVRFIDNQTVKVYIYYELTPAEMLEYETDDPIIDEWVTFNFTTMTVSAPNVDSFDYFSGDTETDFGAGLTLVDSTEEELPTFTAEADDYGFSFHIITGGTGKFRYVIPLSLADLFLTGSMFDVIPNGNSLYGVDTYQLGDLGGAVDGDLLYPVVAPNADADASVETESLNYLAFVFDYFYGLKDYRDIPSFQTYIPIYFPNGTKFETGLYDFVDSLQDMHTGIITTGHNDLSYDHYPSYSDYPAYIDSYFEESYGAFCDAETGNFDLDISGNIAVFKINEFTEEFKIDIEGYMEQIRTAGVDYVVLDLTCNGGGVLAGVFQLLNYLTNEDIAMYTTTLGADSSWTYAVEGDLAIDADFFIATSGVTYSAANLFTALATEMDLAKTIGSPSGGGACSVKAIVLPNGAVLQMSSNMNLTYSTTLTVEEGVGVDYEIDFAYTGKIRIDRILGNPNSKSPVPFPTPAEFLEICEELSAGN